MPAVWWTVWALGGLGQVLVFCTQLRRLPVQEPARFRWRRTWDGGPAALVVPDVGGWIAVLVASSALADGRLLDLGVLVVGSVLLVALVQAAAVLLLRKRRRGPAPG